ncbi:MAG: cell division protein ZipA [Psychrosphaera sp.]|jgi:cell division protein ZipA
MAEELRLALILLGTLAIGSVILHGIWTVRRTVSEERKNAKIEAQEAEPEIAPEEQEMQKLKLKQMEMNFSDLQLTENNPTSADSIPVKKMNLDSIYHKEDQPDISADVTESSDQSTLQQGFNVDVVDTEDKFTNQFEIDDDEDYEQSIMLTDVLDDDDVQKEPSFQAEKTAAVNVEPQSQSEPEENEKQEVFILYIDKSDGTPIDGAKLLPLLLTLGFKYGEMDLFHRHQDNTGRGDILFSLANMFNPGTFDIDNMEQFTTRGLTIFMTLPNNAAPLPTFNMMHNAAKKIADEFSAMVLDDQRRPLDVAIVRSYVERIRRF